MSDIAIRVENLSKRYHIGRARERHDTLRDALVSAVRGPLERLRRPSPLAPRPSPDDTIWALKDVSFEVRRGEVVGVIGRNGAGKSTLLKILSRITEPTSGRAVIQGRVGSLLEVGTGFHPELTGRENIYLNGAILGMRRVEIEKKFDEIVAFAEIEKFLDTPVKRYSSGMYVRLAFAVAAHLDPEILLVDEVLAVGDAAFQKKCLGKMGEVAQEGRTVVFVSHNMNALNSLTPRSVLLVDGGVAFDGITEKAIDAYLGTGVYNLRDLEAYRQTKQGDVEISNIRINDQLPPAVVCMGATMTVSIDIESQRSHANLCITLIIRDRYGRNVSTLCSLDQTKEIPLIQGHNKVVAKLDSVSFTPGIYSIDVALNPSFTDPAWDVIRAYPLAEIVIGSDSKQQSMISPNRTWGVVFIDNVGWEVQNGR